MCGSGCRLPGERRPLGRSHSHVAGRGVGLSSAYSEDARAAGSTTLVTYFTYFTAYARPRAESSAECCVQLQAVQLLPLASRRAYQRGDWPVGPCGMPVAQLFAVRSCHARAQAGEISLFTKTNPQPSGRYCRRGPAGEPWPEVQRPRRLGIILGGFVPLGLAPPQIELPQGAAEPDLFWINYKSHTDPRYVHQTL